MEFEKDVSSMLIARISRRKVLGSVALFTGYAFLTACSGQNRAPEVKTGAELLKDLRRFKVVLDSYVYQDKSDFWERLNSVTSGQTGDNQVMEHFDIHKRRDNMHFYYYWPLSDVIGSQKAYPDSINMLVIEPDEQQYKDKLSISISLQLDPRGDILQNSKDPKNLVWFPRPSNLLEQDVSRYFKVPQKMASVPWAKREAQLVSDNSGRFIPADPPQATAIEGLREFTDSGGIYYMQEYHTHSGNIYLRVDQFDQGIEKT